jgi:arylsulfatase A-like enzyme
MRTAARHVVAALLTAGAAACGVSERAESDRRADAASVAFDLLATQALAVSRIETGLTDVEQLDAGQLRTRGFLQADKGLTGFGEESWLEFYSPTGRARELTLEAEILGWYRRLGGRLEVYVNDVPIVTLSRRDLRARQQISIPAGAVRAGANRLIIQYDSREPTEETRGRVRYATLALDEALPSEEPVLVSDETGTALRLPTGVRQEFFADTAPGARLELAGIRSYGLDDDVVLAVEVARADGTDPYQEILRPGDHSDRSIEIAGTHGPTRIALTALLLSDSGDAGAGIELSRAELTAPSQETSASAPPSPPAAPPNVLIYLIDTLRADHLGVYGYERPTSPNIDAFARDAIVFDAAQAQSSWTKPTVTSMMTGLLPQAHGVQGREDYLAPDARTIASILQLAGYATYAVSTNSTVFADFNFDVGFHEFVELGERPTEEVHQLSDVVNATFFEWLDDRPATRPFFAFLHTTDPHEPYVPREPHRGLLAGDVQDPSISKGPSARRALNADPSLDPQRLKRDMEHLYDAEIAFNDAQFGLLVERLRAEGLYDSTLIIVLSDHGDEFLEHGGWSHGSNLHQEVVHVPLLVKLPDQARGGERIAAIAQHIDLLPTVMQVAGLDFEAGGDGISLLELAESPRAERRPAIAHLALTPALHESVRLGSEKFIRVLPPAGPSRSAMYDLAADPGELTNVDRPVTAGLLESILKRAALTGGGGRSSAGKLILDPEMTERLRALGYIQ